YPLRIIGFFTFNSFLSLYIASSALFNKSFKSHDTAMRNIVNEAGMQASQTLNNVLKLHLKTKQRERKKLK
nr:hypothetical protein [Acholeplasmatales bacterium]